MFYLKTYTCLVIIHKKSPSDNVAILWSVCGSRLGIVKYGSGIPLGLSGVHVWVHSCEYEAFNESLTAPAFTTQPCNPSDLRECEFYAGPVTGVISVTISH